MTSRKVRQRARRGQSLVEFAISAVLVVMMLVGVFEMCRMVLVYTAVGNAAKTGVRYAIVHGANSPVSVTDVKNVVKNFMKAGPLNTANPGLDIQVTYEDGAGTHPPGKSVLVTVVYPYDPLTSYFTLPTINLRGKSQGVITF